MLDNLKLGYAGTSEGMLKLINDSGVLGKTLTDTSELGEVGFDKMIEAVQAVQEQQGIAGTTAREAATTIEGSINMTKGAWSNLLTEMGKEDGDVGARMEELVDSAVTVLIGATDENGNRLSTGILGRVGTIIANISAAIPTMMPKIQAALSEALPQVLQVITDTVPILLSLVGAVFSGVGSVLPSLFQNVLPVVVEQLLVIVQSLTDNIPAMLDAAGQMFMAIASAVIEYGPEILIALGTFLVTLVQTLIDKGPEMLEGAKELFAKAKDGFEEYWPTIKDWFAELPQKILDALGNLGNLLKDAGISIISGLWDGLKEKWNEVTGWVGGLGDWIADHKGPRQYDLGLLVRNGEWIMQSLQTGLENAMPSLEGTLAGITDTIQAGINTNVSVAKAPAQTDAALMGMLGTIRDNMSMKVYLDSGRLVGGIAPQMNTAMGRL